jgi:hypothetical protein
MSALIPAAAAKAADDAQGVASSRMSYSRFLEYLDMGRVKKVRCAAPPPPTAASRARIYGRRGCTGQRRPGRAPPAIHPPRGGRSAPASRSPIPRRWLDAACRPLAAGGPVRERHHRHRGGGVA